jgi:hypothetical protein
MQMIKESSNVSKENVRGKIKKEGIIYKEAQYTSFFGLGGFGHKEGKNYKKGEICQ